MNGNIILIVLSIATLAECWCGIFSQCTCDGTCVPGPFGWRSHTEGDKCNEFCYNGGRYFNMGCQCSSWRSGRCCEDCRHISIPNCIPGHQQCGGSPDGIQCTLCYLPYQSAGYNNGCVRVPCNDRNGLCDHTCLMERGVPRCLCHNGYQLHTNEYSCIDIDECLDGSARCDHICINTAGSFSCTCRPGYTLDSDARTCSDIDECLTGAAKCTQVCTNLKGSFRCTCDTGFQLQSDGLTCFDIDECSVSNGRCSNVCHNLPGSSGFMLQDNSKDCVDIDECKQATSRCSQNCNNTAGSYFCGCRDGFTLGKDNTSCTDVDDCANVACEHGGRCFDNLNSYTCTCTDGYTGKNCEKDIDECAGYLNGGCEDICVNTEGSFKCACSGNTTLQSNGYICSGPDSLSPSLFSRYGLIRQFLPRGCSTILMSSCGWGNTMNIMLSSTSDWYMLKTNRSIRYTFGITFAEINALAMPLSVSGLQVDLSTYRLISGAIQFSKDDGTEVGDRRTHECWSFHITPRDIYDILQANSFTRTGLENIQRFLPDWLSFSHTGDVLVGLNDLRVDIETGKEINHGQCKGAPLDSDKLYTVFKIGKGFSVLLYGDKLSLPEILEDQKYCIVIDICQALGNTVFLILPEETVKMEENVTLFKSLAKRYGIKIHPSGLGLSLTKRIHVETSDIEFWRGEETFLKYRVNSSANVWINGAASMKLGMLRIEADTSAFISVPSFKNFLKSVFFDEWHFGAHMEATTLLLEFVLFGEKIQIDLLDSHGIAPVELYGSLGGVQTRSWCGPHANPSGIFLNVLVERNIFKDIPLLRLIKLDMNTKLHAYLLSDPAASTISRNNSIDLIGDVLNLKNFTESFINMTVKSAFQSSPILTKQSLRYLQDVSHVADQLASTIGKFAQLILSSQLFDSQIILEQVIQYLDDIWTNCLSSLKNHTANFIDSLKSNTRFAMNNVDQLL